jgi:uncharacterized protein
MAEETCVEVKFDTKIPLRDGVRLSATVYRPKKQQAPGPCILTTTCYIVDNLHERGMFFARQGWQFIAVDTRGRGNSEGTFRPNIQEAKDGHDVVEWIAKQPWCNGKVAMFGGSYLGYTQWVTAKEFPPHLTTIVPTASPYFSVDFPIRGNLMGAYALRWLTLVSGITRQQNLFADETFWAALSRELLESGRPFRDLDAVFGNESATFHEWLSHPEQGPYWDQYNPTAEQYAKLNLPILTITGIYDGDQPGALEHYRQHMRNASAEARARHYLIIGPWDHAGCGQPMAEFCGLKIGPAGVLDLKKLHHDWYAWTLQEGPRPEFLKKRVAWYVLGADEWRYADNFEDVTVSMNPLYLHAKSNPTDVFRSGMLKREPSGESPPDSYVYDPRDNSLLDVEMTLKPYSVVDQTMTHARHGKQLVYHSAPFEEDTEVSGFFKLVAWLAIDQPDTDFRVSVFEIDGNGASLLLTTDWIRARYRESLREAKLVKTTEPLRYEFNRFMFVSRLIRKGSRLRLTIGPANGLHDQRNRNAGGVVANESAEDSRTVTVKLFHDSDRPSALYIPRGRGPN